MHTFRNATRHRALFRGFSFSALFALTACGGGGGGGSEPTVETPPPTPAITAISPSQARVGDSLRILGRNFGANQGTSAVQVDGTRYSGITRWSDTEIEVAVPNGAASGALSVTVGGRSSNDAALVIVPTISGIAPTIARTGDTVRIMGSAFGVAQGTSVVSLNGAALPISTWSDSEIQAIVPATATSGAVTVAVGSTTSDGARLIVGPTISTVAPVVARPGDTVSIQGTAFGHTQGASIATLNGMTFGAVVGWSNTEVRVRVQAGASSGPVNITSPDATSNSAGLVIAPVIVALAPTIARTGDTLRITGTGFGSAQGASAVALGGVALSAITGWSDTEIQATLPATAMSGPVSVTVGAATSNDAALIIAPTITSVTPNAARTGDIIRIQGTGFGSTQGSSTVSLNGSTVSAIGRWGNTEIEATVPSGATSGNLIVAVATETSNAVAFTVIPSNAPTIAGLSTPEARIGESIRILGTDFGAAQNASTVTVNGTLVTAITRWSDTEIEIIVPSEANTGLVTVTTSVAASNGVRLLVAWAAQNPDNAPVSTTVGNQTAVQLLADGAGGAFMVWEDRRHGNSLSRIYAQRLDSAGRRLWQNGTGNYNGVPVSRLSASAAGAQTRPRLVSDGSGGALVIWLDTRNSTTTGSDIYAQRLGTDGAIGWTSDAIVSAAVGDQAAAEIVSDSSGGAIVGWHDMRNGNLDIYVQRLAGNGTTIWANDGVAISVAGDTQQLPQIASDGAGGAILAWESFVDINNGAHDIYMQRIDSSGNVQWAVNGAFLVTWHNATGAYRESFAQVVADGTGGAIVVWRDRRNPGLGSNIDAQRVDSTGARQWANIRPGDIHGVPVCEASGNQISPRAISDGSGGAFVVWEDNRDASNANLYAQRLLANGTRSWANGSDNYEGMPVTLAAGEQLNARVASDGADGIIIAWDDYRTGVRQDIYAQRIDASGARRWQNGAGSGDMDGLGISVRNLNQRTPSVVADNDGGAIIGWEDSVNADFDIYAQGVTAGGRQ